MKIGTQLYAPDGWGSLSKSHVYRFLASKADPARVFLVHLYEREHRMKDGGCRQIQHANLIIVGRASFETAIEKKDIVESDVQVALPPWLLGFDGIDLKAQLSTSPSAEARVDRLTAQLRSGVQSLDAILTLRDPIAGLNEHARKQRMNTARYRLHLLVYVLFGKRAELLMPLKFRCGTFSREKLPAGTMKMGRTSRRHGKRHGCNLGLEDKDKIENFYRKNADLGEKKTGLYRRCMLQEFGCKATGKSWKHLYHPQGKPFPTRRQFDYVLEKRIGLKQTQIARFGVERSRNRLQGSRGSYTEHLSNLLECIEADGYTTTRHPVGLNGETLPKLIVVRIVDSVSRMRLGIGFSLDGERSSAYTMAIVCMIMDKVEFCALFGLSITPEEWPSKGWSSRYISDRGAGAVLDIDEIPFMEMTTSYAGQDKAIVESSQRRRDQIAGRPSYLMAKNSPIALAVDEITTLLAENQSVKVPRTPRMVSAQVLPTPIGVWAYLSSYGRSEEVPMPREDAIRLLPQVEVTCTKDGVEYCGERFRSKALEKSGLLDMAARQGSVKLAAYIMPMCIRQFWVEYSGRPIDVVWALPIDDGESQTYLTLDELQALHRQNREDAARLAEHQDAVAIDMADRYRQTFGEYPGKAVRRVGRAKMRTREARKQARAIKAIAEGA